jgi:hypothetical protein
MKAGPGVVEPVRTPWAIAPAFPSQLSPSPAGARGRFEAVDPTGGQQAQLRGTRYLQDLLRLGGIHGAQ